MKLKASMDQYTTGEKLYLDVEYLISKDSYFFSKEEF
jgi:hypothetical protein